MKTTTRSSKVEPRQLPEEPQGLKLDAAETKISAEQSKGATLKMPKTKLNQQCDDRWHLKINANKTKGEAFHPPKEPSSGWTWLI